MKIRWKLRMAAAQREVWTGAQLRRLLAERAGLELSSASVSALFTKEPAQVKLSTLAALCTALECTPNDLFEVDTTPVERPAAPARSRRSAEGRLRPAAGRCRRCDIGPVPMGKKQRDCAGLRRPGRLPRPGALLPVHAADHARPQRKAAVPGLREAAGPAGRAPAGASLCSRRVRAAAGTRSGRRTPPCAGTAGAGARQQAAKQPARGAAGPGCCAQATGWCGHVLHARASRKDPPRVCARLRAAPAACRAGPVLALLAAPPGPARSSGARTSSPG